MIYTDRKYLTILEIAEDRDYVTYDELIPLLTERPSNAVYIERDGILCGMLTRGRILRKRDMKTHRVPFNKRYTSAHLGEYLRVLQIFRDKENVNALPVVSEDGRLLGDYTRWNDLIGTDLAELLCKDPYVLQGLKENIQNAVFVKPVCGERTERRKNIFLWWKHRLESEGLHLQVIQHWEIINYLGSGKKILFVDGDEQLGCNVLYRHLYLNHFDKKVTNSADRDFKTITEWLYYIRLQASMRLGSTLKELQDQGVCVLVFDFKENSNQFLAVLNERIAKRNEESGIHSHWFPEAFKKSFLDELYCGTYKTQEFPFKISYHTRFGIPYMSDVETEFWHIRNGERLTVNQPEKYDRCIYLYGPCEILGRFVSDQYTVPSLLQNAINQAGFSCKVVNRGFPGDYLTVERLQSESDSFKQGDIVVLDHRNSQVGALMENFPVLNLTDALERHNAATDWFIDDVRHCNHKASQVFADEIYKELVPVLRQLPEERKPVELAHDYIDRFYLRQYFSNFDHTSRGTVGSIVMNCNPFTLGHRFLIEEALKTVDFLIVFVVEENESLFSFQERFAMVCQGTNDLERIMVVPSGPYILSKRTFPEYFEKIDDEDLKKNTEDDITLFAEKIAPKLGITYRFVGEELEDKVTNEYNEAMKRILPRYGIQVVEIPRKANDQLVISASRVRECLSMNRMDELDKLVPASTKHILFFESK